MSHVETISEPQKSLKLLLKSAHGICPNLATLKEQNDGDLCQVKIESHALNHKHTYGYSS